MRAGFSIAPAPGSPALVATKWAPLGTAYVLAGRHTAFVCLRQATGKRLTAADQEALQAAANLGQDGDGLVLVEVRLPHAGGDGSSVVLVGPPEGAPADWPEVARPSLVRGDTRVVTDRDKEQIRRREKRERAANALLPRLLVRDHVLVTELAVKVHGATRTASERVLIKDAQRAHIARVQPLGAVPTVGDERLRPSVLDALTKAGMSVEGPSAEQVQQLLPCLQASVYTSPAWKCVVVRVTEFREELGEVVAGLYWPKTTRLACVADAWTEPMIALLLRHGYPVTQVMSKAELEQKDHAAARQLDYDGAWCETPEQRAQWALETPPKRARIVNEYARGLLPGVVANALDHAWATRDWSAPTPESGGQPCRLCSALYRPDELQDRHEAHVRTKGYCPECCADIKSGSFDERDLPEHFDDAIAQALGLLAGQLGVVPSREQCAAPLSEETGGDAAERDRGALLRMALPQQRYASGFMFGVDARRPARGWTEWLRAAGLLEDGWRPGRGTYSTANDGHPCRSLLERHIDDYLHAAGIAHDVEPEYPYDAALNAHGSRADWSLADGTLVEAAGMLADESYQDKMARKQELADKRGIRLLIVTERDLARLDEVFGPWVAGRARSCMASAGARPSAAATQDPSP